MIMIMARLYLGLLTGTCCSISDVIYDARASNDQ